MGCSGGESVKADWEKCSLNVLMERMFARLLMELGCFCG